MSKGMNKVILMGNIGNDPELRTAGESVLLKLRVATSARYRDREEVLQERTEWHNVVVWGKQAEVLGSLLGRGDKVLIEGELRYGSYEKDGVKRYTTDVSAREVTLVGRARSTPSAATARSKSGPSVAPAEPANEATLNDVLVPAAAANRRRSGRRRSASAQVSAG